MSKGTDGPDGMVGSVAIKRTESQDMSSYFITLANLPKFEQTAGLETMILTGLNGEKMMMVLNSTLPGCTVPMHSHPHEQIGMVYSGRALLRIGNNEREVSKGDFYCIPSGIQHGDTCIGDEAFVMLDIFYPVRQDFIDKMKKSIDVNSALSASN